MNALESNFFCHYRAKTNTIVWSQASEYVTAHRRSAMSARRCFQGASVEPARGNGTSDRREPKEPQLSQCPTANENGRPRASGWIQRGVGHGNTDEMESVSANPIASPAQPTGARRWVVPRITIRNMNVVRPLPSWRE